MGVPLVKALGHVLTEVVLGHRSTFSKSARVAWAAFGNVLRARSIRSGMFDRPTK
jgi:hypothetical protein